MSKDPLIAALLEKELPLPSILDSLLEVNFTEIKKNQTNSEIEKLFPKTANQPFLELKKGHGSSRKIQVGVVFSGGQAPGGHNVLWGLHEALKKNHPGSKLLGFLNGPSGLLNQDYIELTDRVLNSYKNLGGFDCLGSGRTKIQTEEQFKRALASVRALKIDCFVIIGGDDSNTNVALLAEHFKAQGQPTSVIGIPKTIDGDLKNNFVEVPFGYDTACRVYSELIGNIAIDAKSSRKYYHFIKLMGRSASHITLECALKTSPNLIFLGEEVAAQKKSLHDLVQDLVNLIIERSKLKKDYGVVLIPEGLIDFIPEFNLLNQELNHLLSKESSLSVQQALSKLSKETQPVFKELPEKIQNQLLLERDPHGNIQLAKIDTQSLLMEMAEKALKMRKDYEGKFNPVSHYLGYEGRSAHPSPFDAHYTYILGYCGALLALHNYSGYMASVRHLNEDFSNWTLAGLPITTLLNLEIRHGTKKPVIEKALLNLGGIAYKTYLSLKQKWRSDDHYNSPGPIQFFGPKNVLETKNWLRETSP